MRTLSAPSLSDSVFERLLGERIVVRSRKPCLSARPDRSRRTAGPRHPERTFYDRHHRADRRPRARRVRRQLRLERRDPSNCAPPGSRCRPSRTRCAASPTTPPTSPARSGRSPGRCSPSATRTAARSSPTPRPTADNVVGLVYVAAFAPDEGEALQDIEGDSKDSVLITALVAAAVPDRAGRGDRGGVRHRPGEVPRRVRRRPDRGAGRRHGRHPAPGLRSRLRRAERDAGLEDPAVVGGGRHRRQGRRQRRRPIAWPSAPEPRSPRSTARTS